MLGNCRIGVLTADGPSSSPKYLDIRCILSSSQYLDLDMWILTPLDPLNIL